MGNVKKWGANVKVYTKLFLDEIAERVNFLICLYESNTNSINIDDSKISDFNIKLLIRRGYIEVIEECEEQLIRLTESGIKYMDEYIETLEDVS